MHLIPAFAGRRQAACFRLSRKAHDIAQKAPAEVLFPGKDPERGTSAGAVFSSYRRILISLPVGWYLT